MIKSCGSVDSLRQTREHIKGSIEEIYKNAKSISSYAVAHGWATLSTATNSYTDYLAGVRAGFRKIPGRTRAPNGHPVWRKKPAKH